MTKKKQQGRGHERLKKSIIEWSLKKNKKCGREERRERDMNQTRHRGAESRQDRQGQEQKKNQGKSGMGADLSVTMVTRQRSDVITSNGGLAWGYFRGGCSVSLSFILVFCDCKSGEIQSVTFLKIFFFYFLKNHFLFMK